MLVKKTKNLERERSSFRDPAGTVFRVDEVLFRRINSSYKADYDLLMDSGLYDQLAASDFIVEHGEVDEPAFDDADYYKTIKPRKIDFISYPYEWSFSQLKQAALLTLKIQLLALDKGMTLKDASAYNIQFNHGRPVLIDTLSFEKYREGSPWVAYRQFCQHFLAPLALKSKTDISMSQLSRIFIDGVPLELASRLLPISTFFGWGLLGHIHLHAKAQKTYADAKSDSASRTTLSRNAMVGLVKSLHSAVEGLEWKPAGTEWGEYYGNTNYENESFDQKASIVETYVDVVQPSDVWDLGANTGVFSRISSRKNIQTVAFDIDPAAVEKNYQQILRSREGFLLPLVMDLTNPSPALGWSNNERLDLTARGPADCVVALALVHHLALSNNVPLAYIAKFLATIGRNLIIEFVPKSDSQVKRLLLSRKDIFGNYDQANFEKDFSVYFSIVRKDEIIGSDRILYLMKKI